jgi:hemerythrin
MEQSNLLNRPLFIRWQDCNNTGIPLIDEQHKGIVSIINTFYYLIGTGRGNNKLYLRIIDTINEYSGIHFTTEEGLLETFEYANIEKHKEIHKKLLLDMERIRQNEIIKVNEAKPLLEFLKKWWIDHINVEDHRYAPHLLAKARMNS